MCNFNKISYIDNDINFYEMPTFNTTGYYIRSIHRSIFDSFTIEFRKPERDIKEYESYIINDTIGSEIKKNIETILDSRYQYKINLFGIKIHEIYTKKKSTLLSKSTLDLYEELKIGSIFQACITLYKLLQYTLLKKILDSTKETQKILQLSKDEEKQIQEYKKGILNGRNSQILSDDDVINIKEFHTKLVEDKMKKNKEILERYKKETMKITEEAKKEFRMEESKILIKEEEYTKKIIKNYDEKLENNLTNFKKIEEYYSNEKKTSKPPPSKPPPSRPHPSFMRIPQSDDNKQKYDDEIQIEYKNYVNELQKIDDEIIQSPDMYSDDAEKRYDIIKKYYDKRQILIIKSITYMIERALFYKIIDTYISKLKLYIHNYIIEYLDKIKDSCMKEKAKNNKNTSIFKYFITTKITIIDEIKKINNIYLLDIDFTQYYNYKENRYVDYSIIDVLKMMGRANYKQQGGKCNLCLVNFYKNYKTKKLTE